MKRQRDRLIVQLTGQPFFEVFPESEREFFYEVVDAQITFVADGRDPATALVLHQNGRNLQARRIN